MKRILLASLALSALFVTFLATPATAAILTNITATGTAIGSVDLTAAGDTNWAAWNTDLTGQTSIAATQQKLVSTGTIGSITYVNGTDSSVRGTSNLPGSYQDVFTWTTTDESTNTPAPGTGILTGAFNTTLNTANTGVTLDITALPVLSGGQSYLINIYTTAFSTASATFSADINGGTAITQPGLAHGLTKTTDYFSISYNPDDIGDTLNISYVMTAGSTISTSDHVAIQAIAISIVPEPATIGLTLVGLTALASRRRRPTA